MVKTTWLGPVLLVAVAACGSSGESQDSPLLESGVEALATSVEARPVTRNRDGVQAGARVASAKPDRLQSFTGARTRVVWTQDVAHGTDIGSAGDRLLLMGYDSRDGLGERPILRQQSNYAKPLFTPLGDRIAFSNLQEQSVFIVNWDGSALRKLGKGFALATWIDPKTRTEWVYVGRDEARDPPSFGSVTRHQIDRWEVRELVWDKRPVSGDTFQVSSDGRLAGGLFPWPTAGVAELPNGSFRRMGRGCWTALAGGDSQLFWIFDGAHRNLTIVDVDGEERWQVKINDAPGIDGYEIYHPRWANHPRFLTMTGPYTVGTEANKIRGGGRQVEIYLGRFAADFTDVESWVRVTDNRHADFYPDAWIDPGEQPAAAPKRANRGARASLARDPERSDRLVVEARVVENAPIPTPESIAPYRRALLVNEYEVVNVLEGSYQRTKILVARWVIRDGKVLDTAVREPGTVHRMTLEAYDEHAELEGERLVMDSDAFDLPLYYHVDS